MVLMKTGLKSRQQSQRMGQVQASQRRNRSFACYQRGFPKADHTLRNQRVRIMPI